jgi:hypothetical protein
VLEPVRVVLPVPSWRSVPRPLITPPKVSASVRLNASVASSAMLPRIAPVDPLLRNSSTPPVMDVSPNTVVMVVASTSVPLPALTSVPALFRKPVSVSVCPLVSIVPMVLVPGISKAVCVVRSTSKRRVPTISIWSEAPRACADASASVPPLRKVVPV